jgi:hypothetical protein
METIGRGDNQMTGLLFRTSVLLGVIGMVLGIVMGIRQDFALAPAHAHLNLAGFVVPFLSALYYRAVPGAAEGVVAKIQAAAAIVGAILFPIGIAGVTVGDHDRFMPVVVSGSLIVLLGMLLFAFVVFHTCGAAKQ